MSDNQNDPDFNSKDEIKEHQDASKIKVNMDTKKFAIIMSVIGYAFSIILGILLFKKQGNKIRVGNNN